MKLIGKRDAVERNFEIIGEAVGRIDEGFKHQNSQIEWRVLKDFRNFIIHEYFGINNQMVWDSIQIQLPGLLMKVRALIEANIDSTL